MLKERGIITNDNTKMVPLTEYEGRVLKYDFPELHVGIAEYKEIDNALKELVPLVEGGGFIPTVDHTFPPDISWDNFCYYMEQKKKLLNGTFEK